MKAKYFKFAYNLLRTYNKRVRNYDVRMREISPCRRPCDQAGVR